MSNERVTLSDEEREAVDATLADVAGSVLPTAMHRTVERILAAREQTPSEENARYEAIVEVVEDAAHWVALADERSDLPVFSTAYRHTNILRRLVAAWGETR